MIENEDEIFSAEYNTSENTETQTPILKVDVTSEPTTISKDVEYSISKPQRIIIKAIIKND